MDEIHVLLVEDNLGDARLLREAVADSGEFGIHLTHVDRLSRALERLAERPFDVVLLDLSLPDADGISTLVRMNAQSPSTPIVVLTGRDDEELAIQAVREGAQDYLFKGKLDGPLLVRSMKYATERKRAVEALQQREEYFRSLIDNALDLIAVLNADGTFVFASPSHQRILGYTSEELVGRNALDLLHPEDLPTMRSAWRSHFGAAAAGRSLEVRLRHRDGSYRLMEAFGNNLLAHPLVRGVVINSRDITERKRAGEAVREANETLRAVIDTSPLAICTVSEDGTVQSWNRAAERILARPEADAVGSPLSEALGMAPEHSAQWLADIKLGRPLEGREIQETLPNGEKAELSVWSGSLREGTEDTGRAVLILADNRERKRLEAQVRQSQKMDAVGRLAGGIAHDFNNLLTVITGYGQILLSQMAETDEGHGEMLQVLKAADRAAQLTRQLLAFSRRQIAQPKVVDVNELLDDLDQMLRPILGENIQVRKALEPGLGRVKADPGQLGQVLVNLVVNARDAMPAGGTLTIETANAEVDDRFARQHVAIPPGAYVMLAVSDTGGGVPLDARAHLFEPFFTTKDKGKGTGLGLSTSYAIVRQHGGDIWFYSELGTGTTFKVLLPRVDERAESPAHLRDETPVRGSERVLVVEDEDDVRRVLVEMLRGQGYQVTAADGPQEALQLMDRLDAVDLLVTDVMMPHMGGQELAERLRSTRPDLRVLFVSGYTDGAILQHGLLEPGTAFLQKPFSSRELAKKIRDVLAD